jgi:aspartate/glutamate racemase
MGTRSIGIIAGGGGPLGSINFVQDIVNACQKKFNSWRSYEYPTINFYSYPYSEMFLAKNNDSMAARELSHCIQQLRTSGMEIIVIPCFTVASYLTYRQYYPVELIEMGPVIQSYLDEYSLFEPMVICSNRTKNSKYCDRFFNCSYPSEKIQTQITLCIEQALKGEKVDLRPILDQLPDVPIVCAGLVLSAQMKKLDDPRFIDSRKILADYVVERSFKGTIKDNPYPSVQLETQIEAMLTLK